MARYWTSVGWGGATIDADNPTTAAEKAARSFFLLSGEVFVRDINTGETWRITIRDRQAVGKEGITVGRVSEPNEEGYAGWPNWETWFLFSTLTNDPDLYREVQQLVREYDAAALRDYVRDVVLNIDALSITAGDVVQALVEESLNRVAWFRLWEALRELNLEGRETP